MVSKYVIMSCDDDDPAHDITFAYFNNIEDARKGFEYVLKYHPDQGYQLYECALTRISHEL